MKRIIFGGFSVERFFICDSGVRNHNEERNMIVLDVLSCRQVYLAVSIYLPTFFHIFFACLVEWPVCRFVHVLVY